MRKPAGPFILAIALSLAACGSEPAPPAANSAGADADQVRYEASGGAAARGEIWCGGEKIADFDVVRVD